MMGWLKGELWRHVKTGGIYRMLMHATNEADLKDAVVYQNINDGRTWVRPATEFYDGRFEEFSSDLSYVKYGGGDGV